MSRFKISKVTIDGKTWYVPKRRILLFFWTKEFKCKDGRCVSESMRSMNVHDAVEFIVDNAKYQRRLREKWSGLLSPHSKRSVV